MWDSTTVVLNYNFGDTNEVIDINLVVFLLIHDCCLVLCLLCCWYNFWSILSPKLFLWDETYWLEIISTFSKRVYWTAHYGWDNLQVLVIKHIDKNEQICKHSLVIKFVQKTHNNTYVHYTVLSLMLYRSQENK